MRKTILMLLILLPLSLHSQNADPVTVSGTVVDAADRQPVIGASVAVEGTVQGAITDLDGHFSLSVGVGQILKISCIGYIDASYAVNGAESDLILILNPSSEMLEGTVVVGYGSVKKENLSGAVDQVSAERFEGRPVANATQMLMGAVPNLNITLADGKPNRSASYNIRGTTSIGAGGSALILIDGVEGDPAMLNPNDIESVSVLKDAASAAIYGSRAPYGVVLITTKSADKDSGKFSITYDGNFSIETPTAVPDIIDDGYVYASLFYEAWYNHRHVEPTGINKSQEFTTQWLEEYRLRQLAGNKVPVSVGADGRYVYYGNTDWYDLLYKDYVTAQTHNVSISGKSDKITYYLSGRIYDYDGLINFNTDTYRTMNLRSKTSAQVLPWLKITENIDYTYDDYYFPQGTDKEAGGVFWRAMNDEGHPSSPLFNPDGTLTYSGAYALGGLVTGNNYLDRITSTLKTTTSLSSSFFDNSLRFNGDFSFRSKDYNESKKVTAVPYSAYEGVISYLGVPGTGDYIKETNQRYNYMAVNAFGEYEKKYAEKHYMKLLAGYNYEQQTYKGTYSTRYGLITPDVEHINLALGEEMLINSGGNKWRYAGFFFRANYAFADRYLLEVNGRYDGSSKFPSNSQWGFFPSVSAAWRLSQEPWWKVNKAFISSMKLRASYGELGNGNVSPYSYMEKFTISTMSSRFLNGTGKLRYTDSPSIVPDNIGWERSRTYDLGLDASFLYGRLNVTADAYIRKTLDMYTAGPTLPDTFGAASPKGNYADMTTRGYELSLDYNDSFNLSGKPFNWSVKATLADYVSVIDRYNNDSRKLSDYYAGQTVGELWGFVSNGLFQNQDEIDAAFDGTGYVNTLIETSQNGVTYPGDIRYEDLNHNHAIDKGAETADDAGDMKIIGNTQPRYIYSFSLGGDWNGFSFSAFFQGVGHQDWYPGSECPIWGQYNRPYDHALKWMIGNYWTEDNPDAYLPRYTGYYQPFYKASSYPCTRYLQNVAYIRLKNAQIGYALPKNLVKKAGLASVKVYFSGENLWTWSPLYRWTRDFDVLTITRSSDSDISGTNRGSGYNYPSLMAFSFGVTIKY